MSWRFKIYSKFVYLLNLENLTTLDQINYDQASVYFVCWLH